MWRLPIYSFILFHISFGVMSQGNLSKSYDSLKSVNYELLQTEAIIIAQEKGWPIRTEFPDGGVMELQYIDRHGQPVYYITDNIKAAQTTNTISLRPSGNLGVNLTGKGMTVGIWDAGAVRVSHVELTGKTQQLDNTDNLAGHATHVAGTILATGINPQAIGMAPEARAKTFDFSGDLSEMSTQAEQGLLLSNHSYGLQLGWNYNSSNGSWEWNGVSEVSDEEDYRFGLYTSQSRSVDMIAFSNPFYTIVKSAGNDRSDVGNGTHPADGPYDIIGPKGIAKNIITVGAVNPVLNYTGPQDVVMSTFSSWGPSDDGRIKPDIVADGVGVFSSSSDGDNSYATLSGTSMAAPNVTGSLALLQQLYEKTYDQYMLSSTLKGLVIHTVKEAGSKSGPDYQFGWGLLDTEAAAKQIMLSGSPGYIIKEDTLQDTGEELIEIELVAGAKVTATLAWIDVPGNAISEQVLDPIDLNLVNDLDLRIYAPDNSVFLPWKIEPGPKSVSKGDNYRDNVEKIEFVAPSSGTYTIRINHKYSLTNGFQAYSLIASANEVQDQLESFYFQNNSDDLNDINNWASDMDGTMANRLPGPGDIIIFDGVNFNANKVVVNNITDNYSGISVRNLDSLIINDPLIISQMITVSEAYFEVNNTINLLPNSSAFIDNQGGEIKINKLELSGAGEKLKVSGNIQMDTFMVSAGEVAFDNNISAKHVLVDAVGPTSLDFTGIEISQFETLKLKGESNLILHDDYTIYRSPVIPLVSVDVDVDVSEVLINSEELFLSGTGMINYINLPALTTINGNLKIADLDLLNAQQINFTGSTSLSVISLEGGNDISMIDDGGTPSTIISNNELKICFANIHVDGVNVEGSTKFVVNETSQVLNATGWIMANCDDVLTARFTVEYPCAKGITTFKDMSDGNPGEYRWYINDELISTDSLLIHVFPNTGTYDVSLLVIANGDSSQLYDIINVNSSSLGVPTIVQDNNVLRTTAFAPNYQWYYNNDTIAGANGFELSDFEQPGFYTIDIWNSSCKMRSAPYEIKIVGVEQLQSVENNIKIFPNPVNNRLSIESSGAIEYNIYNLAGKQQLPENKSITSDGDKVVELGFLKAGFYLLVIQDQNNQVHTFKFIKK